MAVEKAYRGQGLGKALALHVVSVARMLGQQKSNFTHSKYCRKPLTSTGKWVFGKYA
jgi:GNAT superfamily N-acetyltransferase